MSSKLRGERERETKKKELNDLIILINKWKYKSSNYKVFVVIVVVACVFVNNFFYGIHWRDSFAGRFDGDM